VLSVSASDATLRLSHDEVRMLRQSMNEAFEAVEDWETPIRMGFEVARLLSYDSCRRNFAPSRPKG
jgi:hypothetical protein